MSKDLGALEFAAPRDASVRAVLADALEERGLAAHALALRGFHPPPALRPVSLRLERSVSEPPLETPGYRRYSQALTPTLAVVGDFGIASRPLPLEDRRAITLGGSIDKVIVGAGVSLSGGRGLARSLADLEHAAPSVRASWRAAAWLSRVTAGIQLELFTADKAELHADLEAASSVRRAALYSWLRPLNHPGMHPFFGALVLPELSPTDDLPLAERIAAVAAELAIPIVLSLDGTAITELGAGWEELRRAPGARFLAVGATPFRVEGELVASGVALAAGVANTWSGDAMLQDQLSPVPCMGFRPAPFSEAVLARARGISLLRSTHQPTVAVALASGAEGSVPLTWALRGAGCTWSSSASTSNARGSSCMPKHRVTPRVWAQARSLRSCTARCSLGSVRRGPAYTSSRWRGSIRRR